MSTMIEKNTPPRERNTLLVFSLAVLAIVLLAAVAIWQLGLLPANPPAIVEGVEGQEAVWTAQEIDSYQYDLAVSCFCIVELTRPVTILVENGEVASITYVDDGTPADPQLFAGFAPMEQLFERLSELEAENPVKFDVVYDEELGIPLSADIDVSEMIADEELRFTVSNFAPQS